MRVNHSGEVCAQALYCGQAWTAKTSEIQGAMQQAAAEESDHLRWCENRIASLKSHKSLLNPVWYAASWLIGVTAGIAGDKWSLGFLQETENQVVDHLQDHIKRLPKNDKKSLAVLQQMKIDESKHATQALRAGAVELPYRVKRLMASTSRIMTRVSYWI